MTNSGALLKTDRSKIAFLPIKPKYAERLLSGSKWFEYRRRPISPELIYIVVYASSLKKRTVGILRVKQVHVSSPSQTWRCTTHGAGITRSEFQQYFTGTDKAYAIEINPSDTICLSHELLPTDIKADFRVPQSFVCVDENFLDKVAVLGKGEA